MWKLDYSLAQREVKADTHFSVWITIGLGFRLGTALKTLSIMRATQFTLCECLLTVIVRTPEYRNHFERLFGLMRDRPLRCVFE